jgi:hypothetical protein
MHRKPVWAALVLWFFLLPHVLYAQAGVEYQNRGNRYEGIKSKPVSGYDIEVISALVAYKDKDTADQLPDLLRVTFFLKDQVEVNITVREQDYRLFYWLDRVRPDKRWRAGSYNEFTWPAETVLRQLEDKLKLYDLGVLIRLRNKVPSSVEDIAPAMLYHTAPAKTVDGYLFTLKTNGDVRLVCSVYRAQGSGAIMTQTFSRIPGGRPFTIRWDVRGVEEADCTLICNGYFLDSNQPIAQTLRFHHKPKPK